MLKTGQSLDITHDYQIIGGVIPREYESCFGIVRYPHDLLRYGELPYPSDARHALVIDALPEDGTARHVWIIRTGGVYQRLAMGELGIPYQPLFLLSGPVSAIHLPEDCEVIKHVLE